MEKLKAKGQKIKSYVDFLGNACIGVFHYLGLFLIGGVVIWASLIELKHVFNMVSRELKMCLCYLFT